jgi:hypothetical protein
MSIFTTLAIVRLNIESIKRLKLGGSQAYDINCLDCGYILGQYMGNRHNLLYKTWVAGLRRRRKMLKNKTKKKLKKV